MKYFFRYWDRLKKGLRNKKILFLDYDGTLTPIVGTPQDAVISKENKNLLQCLSKRLNYKLAIVSGRALKDIKNRIGIRDIIYIGSHGLEVEGPNIKFTAPIAPSARRIIRRIRDILETEYSKIKGVIVEDKGVTFSIHYRLINKKDFAMVKNIFNRVTTPHVVSEKIKINMGKKIFEVRPNIIWDKGKVVHWFINRYRNAMPIYIGDDITDEDAFKELKDKGLSIFVGRPKKSCAEYYLRNTQDVTKFLRYILCLN